MTPNDTDRDALLEELAAFLEMRIDGQRQTLARLDALRAAVIRRDEPALSELFDQVRIDNAAGQELDAIQLRLGRRLASAFGLDEPVNLTRLCGVLDAQPREVVRQKQQLLLELTRRVQTEHTAAEMLLRECARCNRQLLEAILGRSSQTVTYTAQGQNRVDMHRGLVNLKY